MLSVPVQRRRRKKAEVETVEGRVALRDRKVIKP